MPALLKATSKAAPALVGGGGHPLAVLGSRHVGADKERLRARRLQFPLELSTGGFV